MPRKDEQVMAIPRKAASLELQSALQQLKAECERSQTDSVWMPMELEMLGKLDEDGLEDLFCESLKNSTWQSFRSKIMQIYPFYQRAALLSSDTRLHGKLAELLMIQTRVRPELLQYCLENEKGGHDSLAFDPYEASLGFMLFDTIPTMPSVLCAIIEEYVQYDFRTHVKEWLYKNVHIWVWLRGAHSAWLTRVLYSDEPNLLATLQREFTRLQASMEFTKRITAEDKQSLQHIMDYVLEQLSETKTSSE